MNSDPHFFDTGQNIVEQTYICYNIEMCLNVTYKI